MGSGSEHASARPGRCRAPRRARAAASLQVTSGVWPFAAQGRVGSSSYNDPLNKIDPLGLRARDRELIWAGLLDGWEWRESYEECLQQGGLIRHSDIVSGGTDRWVGSMSDQDRLALLASCSGRGPTEEDIAQACMYGGRAGCILEILLAHGFPADRAAEVVSFFCGGLGDFDGRGCATGAAIADPLFDFLLIDLPVGFLASGFTKAFITGAGKTITPPGGLRPGQVADAIDYDSLTFTETVAGHLGDVTKTGLPSRPYMDSPMTLREITRAADPVPDPGGLANGWRWDVPGMFRGSQGTWELVIDLDTNRVVHWNFTR